MASLVITISIFLLISLLVCIVRNEDITSTLLKDNNAAPIALTKAEQHPVPDFSRHTLVKPKIYHGREKRQISSTKSQEENGQHLDHLQITLEVDGEDMILDLSLNKQLIPKGFFHKHQENGDYKIHRPNAQQVNLCQYNGKVRGKPNSWVAISTCDGLSGVIFDGHEMHYIEKETKVADGDLESNHFLYRHSDLVETNKTCGYGGDAINHEHFHLNDNRILRYKRDTNQNELVRGPYNANKESKYVELVLVIDNQEYKELGESRTKVLNHAKTIANIINGLYSPLNIFIALVGVVIWSESNEINVTANGDTTLTNFLHYRRKELIISHPNDNAQLLTKFNFEHGVVGKALKGPICTYEFSGGVNTDHSHVVGLVATTIAHEMGHNFGMEHDTNECKCEDQRCIMAPSSSTVAPTHWSSCSLNYLLLAFAHGMDYCLKNKPESLFESPVCGNGFVEQGEQCDCGLPEHCGNTCCNATTCTLYSNASCATGECCDLTTCRPKNAGTLCRSADYECDLPEYCTGQSEYCPSDIYKLDTESCDGGKAYCYKGFCRTRSDQCRLLWGETGKSSDDQCYTLNINGTRSGNCGYNKLTQSFFKCDEENVLCGMLHCKHLNERLEFGMESVAILSHTFINKKGSIIPCRTAIIDLGLNQIDPGLTPDGALCGDGKMCVNQKCMSVSNLRRQGPACPQDCNGNGWCNNKGHCHCKEGFAPPNCDYPGPGGSEDSGPASDPNARQGVVAALFIIFLGVIPFIAIVALLSYYARHNLKFNWKRPSTLSSSSLSSSATSHRTKSPLKSRGPSFPTETAKRTEDNHSLLHEDSPPPEVGFQNSFFGNFKGFSITPAAKKSDPEPIRTAPPPPKTNTPKTPATTTVNRSTTTNAETTKSSLFNKPIQKYNSFRNNSLLSNGVATTPANNISSAPALPPLNPGSNARPIISSPVLENSTCTAKELISPLRNAPKVPIRSAPETPVIKPTNELLPIHAKDPVASNVVLNVKIEEQLEPLKKPKEISGNSTLNRIASFLKHGDKKPSPAILSSSSNVPKPSTTNQVKATKVLDKGALRNMEISNPIPQTDIEIAITALPVDSVASKAVVMRAQSMRVTNKDKPNKPNIHTFGSMRQPSNSGGGGFKRPLSIPSGTRPKSPPPPRPPLDRAKEASVESNQYDDCLNEEAPLAKLSEISPSSGDNIYAVIEESPILSPTPVKAVTSSSGSSESMGLLGEIVSEIQNRNFDSIYSTSTLARKKKKEAEEQLKREKEKQLSSPDASDTSYVNTSSLQYPDGSEYSNMSGNVKSSSASSTSSGYILPSAINKPVVVNKHEITGSGTKTDVKPPAALSTFKADGTTKPFASTFNRPQGPLASSYNNKTSSVKKVETSPDRSNNKSKTTPPSPTKVTTSSAKAVISRQVTPPNLRTRKPSPTRSAPQAPKSSSRSSVSSNSPDLVTSCSNPNSNSSSSKPPDVLGGSTISAKKPTISTSKPSTAVVPKAQLKSNQKPLAGSKSVQEKKPANATVVGGKVSKACSDVGSAGVNGSKTATTTPSPVGLRNAAKSTSNVASLQQKFENKNSSGNNGAKVKT